MLFERFCSKGQEDDDCEEDRRTEIGEIASTKKVSENKIKFVIMIFLLFFHPFLSYHSRRPVFRAFAITLSKPLIVYR